MGTINQKRVTIAIINTREIRGVSISHYLLLAIKSVLKVFNIHTWPKHVYINFMKARVHTVYMQSVVLVSIYNMHAADASTIRCHLSKGICGISPHVSSIVTNYSNCPYVSGR